MNDFQDNVFKIIILWDFLGYRVDKNPLANAGDTGLILGPGRFHMPWSSPCTISIEPPSRAQVPQLVSLGALEPAHHSC